MCNLLVPPNKAVVHDGPGSFASLGSPARSTPPVRRAAGARQLAVVTAALTALGRLDQEHAAVYFQVVCNALREPMRRALEELVMERKTEGKVEFPPFVQQLIDRGELRGRTEEAARAVLTVLRVRGIAVPEAERDRILAETDPARLERWLERAILAASVAEVIDEPSRAMRRVFLDPDGMWPSWLAVVIAAPTGVMYAQQCAGVAAEERSIEGYLVPVAGPKVHPEEGIVEPSDFRKVFHNGARCNWGAGIELPDERLGRLRRLVEHVPFWYVDATGDTRSHLALDDSQTSQLVEAWVPVTTPHGPGVLLWDNCD